MRDELVAKAEASYKRECPDCNVAMPFPTTDDLLQGETACLVCGQVYDIDAEDRNFFIAFLIARVERLERRTRNPLEGLGL